MANYSQGGILLKRTAKVILILFCLLFLIAASAWTGQVVDKQYFSGVPTVAWEFYIGGYQPAQKWLKDRKGRELGYEDIEHYRKMIGALMETERIMKEIDEIAFF